MLRRLWCGWFHKKTWDNLDSQCYEVGPTGLIQLVFDHCKKCNLYMPAVFWIPQAGARLKRLV